MEVLILLTDHRMNYYILLISMYF